MAGPRSLSRFLAGMVLPTLRKEPAPSHRGKDAQDATVRGGNLPVSYPWGPNSICHVVSRPGRGLGVVLFVGEEEGQRHLRSCCGWHSWGTWAASSGVTFPRGCSSVSGVASVQATRHFLVLCPARLELNGTSLELSLLLLSYLSPRLISICMPCGSLMKF